MANGECRMAERGEGMRSKGDPRRKNFLCYGDSAERRRRKPEVRRRGSDTRCKPQDASVEIQVTSFKVQGTSSNNFVA